MIGRDSARDTSTLVSYPTTQEAPKSFKIASDQSCDNPHDDKPKQSAGGTKSSSLYDPLDQSSDEDEDDGKKEKEVKGIQSKCESHQAKGAERMFREEVVREQRNDSRQSSKNSKLVEKKEPLNTEKPCKRNKRDSSSDGSASPKNKKRRMSPSLKKSVRNRSRSRDRSKERHRRRHNSRDRSSSRNRHKHRSSKASRRSRSRSRSKHHDRRRQEKHRSRSNSVSRRRPSRSNPSASKTNGPSKGSNPKNFKEQLKAMFLQTQGQTVEEIEREVQLDDRNLLTANEKKSSLPLNSSNPLAAMVAGGSKATAQQALAQTMAAMHAKVQEITGVAVPKYYNPAAINPIKYAEQLKKRKLLWSKNKEVEKDKEVDVKTQAQWSGTSFVADQDGKMAAKFRKLMGIKEDEKIPTNDDLGKSTEEQRKKQEELFQQLAREYDFARMTTHTCRGVGLGFTSHNLPQS